jgi:hypothetical protein
MGHCAGTSEPPYTTVCAVAEARAAGPADGPQVEELRRQTDRVEDGVAGEQAPEGGVAGEARAGAPVR